MESGLTPEKIMELAHKARAAWSGKFSSEKQIKEVVFERLNTAFESVILNTLGIKKDTWDGWKIDETNGRRTELSRRIASEAEKVVPLLMEKHKKLFTEDVLTKEQVLGLKKYYSEQVMYKMRDAVCKLADANAEAIARELMAEETAMVEDLLNRDLGGEELAK